MQPADRKPFIETDTRFEAPYGAPDETLAAQLLSAAPLSAEAEARIDVQATKLIGAIRAKGARFGDIDDVLREYSLSTSEGLALMVLAEALLRVPDPATADWLIEDKLGHADWSRHVAKSASLLVAASAWALGISANLIQPGETPDGVLAALAKRIGKPAVRRAARQTMRLLGSHFVLGETIEAALERAQSSAGRRYRYSFDMLGEGARTAADAERYRLSYLHAIEAIGRSAGNATLPARPGISVKFSALHPRYEAVSRARVLRELVPVVVDLACQAARHQLNFTVDAEEADRLELSLEVIAAVAADPRLAAWNGFGIAVQAYSKRALAVVEWTEALAERLDRRFMVRLVKGAYWDTEIKRAQERGLADYPVLTRKAMTDLNFLACADRLLDAPRLYPQFATHNALTVASVLERARQRRADGAESREAEFEFQRLHGMGEELYRSLLADREVACRTYAPVGTHEDLLAYLVRRLLENGANSSFVAMAGDPAVPVRDLLRRPASVVGNAADARHPRLALPADLYQPQRRNSAGIEFGHRRALDQLLEEVRNAEKPQGPITALVNGEPVVGRECPARSPVDGRPLVPVVEASPQVAESAVGAAHAGFHGWQRRGAVERAAILGRAADLLEEARGRFVALLVAEGGKTLDDAVAEVREAADFLRFYGAQAVERFGACQSLPGPTGEDNRRGWRGRGVFICISPWNFPLAIFVGQIAAALASGNAVVAKPAEQTPAIGREAVRLLHGAGVPPTALQFVPGVGTVGAALVAHPRVAGVAFTGSTATGWAINRALAAKDGPIVPLVAETGGINAMIVDATALPEQVTDDVITSAFRSAGQRCSALRLLCVQEDVADKLIGMIAGAAAELRIGDPHDPGTHVGPVIDADARAQLLAHIAAMSVRGRLRYAGSLPPDLPAGGFWVAPHIFELGKASDLDREVFGPILHVVRFKAHELDLLLGAIGATGYGLTLGIHSRIDAFAARVIERSAAGNVYVNRSMIGAVVGTQPFGGSGLSGTGPKAGGPDYLTRYALEQVVSTNTAASGGNASLLVLKE